MRKLLERAVAAAGLHVTEGNKIWEAYREFEQALCLTINDSQNEVNVKIERPYIPLHSSVFT